MNELKNKSIRYQIGYWFFLAMGLIGASYQTYKYLTDKLELSWAEFLITGVFVVLVFEPMILSKGLNLFIKSMSKTKNE